MKELTIIQKNLPKIRLKDSQKSLPLVIDVKNPEILGGMLATMSKQAFRMAGTEMADDDIVTLIEDFLSDYTHEPIEDFVSTIINIRKGKYKVYYL